MKCKSITLNSFRNIEAETLEFCDGVNVLWGKNAQGKSNMLEGIYFFARGRSFRGAKEKEMIRFQDSFSSLSLDFIKDSDTYTTNLTVNLSAEGRKTITRNGARLSGTKEMIGSFRAVLFCPAHLTLVSGGPALRRSFMDIALSQLYPAYLDSLSRYNKALLQRNALIKKAAGSGKSAFDDYIWETYAEQMATYGSFVAKKRSEYMTLLSGAVEKLFSEMTEGAEKPSLIYRSSLLSEKEEAEEGCISGKDKLYEALLSNIDREIHMNATLYGVHKDDIQIKLNSKDAKTYASQGQQRSLALAMKLSEGEMSKRIGGEYPVFLLDDVLSELDGDRRRYVLTNLSDRQLIVTSCEPDIFRSLSSEARLLHTQNGKIVDIDGK